MTQLTPSSAGKMVILLDELFKGTNYQDAYNSTINLINSISSSEECVFFISSHITELTSALQNNGKIELKYLQTFREDNNVKFTYLIRSGVATDKLGSWF